MHNAGSRRREKGVYSKWLNKGAAPHLNWPTMDRTHGPGSDVDIYDCLVIVFHTAGLEYAAYRY